MLLRNVVTAQAMQTDSATKANRSRATGKIKHPPKIATLLMQGFGWDSCKHDNYWRELTQLVPKIAAAGVTHLHLPPPSVSVSPEGYIPGQLYNLESKYGNKDDLIALNTALLAAGVMPVADIVINHRTADEQNENGVWNRFHDDTPHPGRRIDWGEWAITGNDPEFEGEGKADSGENYGPSPDIDHRNEVIREGLIDWLRWLKEEVGFEGWRFDYTKGYAAKYVSEYIEKTVGLDCFCVGEDWVDLKWNGSELDYNQDHARQTLVDWSKASNCAAFDFVTKGVLQEAVKNTQYDRLKDSEGKPIGMLGWWPEQAVTFVDNHDTGSSQNHWPFPAEKVMEGYAYILTHPGIPTLFYEHYFEWGLEDEIRQLVEVRNRNGINAASSIHISCADADMYVATINDSVVLKLGPRVEMGSLLPKEAEGWKMACNGEAWAVWEKKE